MLLARLLEQGLQFERITEQKWIEMADGPKTILFIFE